MKIMAFIPARGGSKGIPRKNLALLNGKPLIQYTLEAAQKSKKVDEIFISTEDSEIIALCRPLGFEFPYIRPEELATDTASLVDVIIHALDWKKKNKNEIPDAVVLLQPTSPLRSTEDIDGAIEQFIIKKVDTLIGVHAMIEHPYECIRLVGNSWSYLARPSREVYRRQDYRENFYFINGAIYIVKTDFLMKEKKLIVEGVSDIYFMSPAHGIDIDHSFQLKLAEFFMGNEIEKFFGDAKNASFTGSIR